MAEALDAEDGLPVGAVPFLGQELLGSQAVADRTDADADGIQRHAQERVERDDLMDLAAADVHVVGERVRELRRDGADLPPHAAQVVEQAGARGRQLRQELGELQDVDSADDKPRIAPQALPERRLSLTVRRLLRFVSPARGGPWLQSPH